MSRKVIQLATMPEVLDVHVPTVNATLYALCDDGTMWARDKYRGWTEVHNVPQHEKATND